MENNYSANIPLDEYHALIEKATLYDKVINDPSAKLVIRYPQRFGHGEYEVYQGEEYIKKWQDEQMIGINQYIEDLKSEIERLEESNSKFREVFDIIKNK